MGAGSSASVMRKVGRAAAANVYRFPQARDSDILIGIAAGIAIFAGLAAIYLVLSPALHFKEDPQVTQVMNLMFAKPLWWRLTLIFRGTIAEEIIFADTLSSGFKNSPAASASRALFLAPSSPWSTWGFGAGAI